MAKKLLKLRKELLIDEACDYVARNIGEEVSTGDLVRAVILQKLKISVLLNPCVELVSAKLTKPVDRLDQFEASLVYCTQPVQAGYDAFDLSMKGNEVKLIAGVIGDELNGTFRSSVFAGCFFYPVFERAGLFYLPFQVYDSGESLPGSDAHFEKCKFEIAAKYSSNAATLALEEKERLRRQFLNRNLHFELGHKKTICLPADDPPTPIDFVFRLTELDKFCEYLNDADGSAKRDDAGRSIGARERNTLLVLIAALAREANFDLNKRGIVASIELLTQQFGAPVSDDTIRRVLNQIPEAVEARKK